MTTENTRVTHVIEAERYEFFTGSNKAAAEAAQLTANRLGRPVSYGPIGGKNRNPWRKSVSPMTTENTVGHH